jgi:hypothetical protein
MKGGGVLDGDRLLAAIPLALRGPLLDEYRGLADAYASGKWKATSLDAGRFCEVVFSILEGALSGTFPSAPEKPSRFVESCRALEKNMPVGVGDHSLRILIPRVLPGMYDIRNNRNVGHVGGDVMANEMDATFVRHSAAWVLCELVRVFHGVSIAEAQEAIDALTERQHPIVWEHEGIKRVLDPEMGADDRTLVLLYNHPGWCTVRTLLEWVTYPRNFRNQVLSKLAAGLFVEFDRHNDRVVITPRGLTRAEKALATARA